MIGQPYRVFGGVSEDGKPPQFNGESRLQPKGTIVFDRRQAVDPGGERPVRPAQELAAELRQSYRRVGKFALIKHQRYAHAKQFKRANRSLGKLKPISAASSATFGAKRPATRA